MDLLNKYQQVIIGKSYVSLIFGILEKEKHGHDILIVDDPRFEIGDQWNSNIGELEKKAIKLLGFKYSIPCLEKFEDYIEQANTMIYLNDKMVELGSSPFSNIKELARKLPECFSKDFIEGISEIDPAQFDQEVDSFFEECIKKTLEERNYSATNILKTESKLLEPLFDRFIAHLQSDKLISKQLHYILQALYQTILSNVLAPSEVRFLLASVLSPRYRVDKSRLEDELTFVFKTMGGFTKKAEVQEFKTYKKKLEYILLGSYEGVIKTERAYLFGHFEQGVGLDYNPGQTVYHSLKLHAPIHHKLVPRLSGKRILFSDQDRMGTDFPHWEILIKESKNGEQSLEASYVYACYEGSKPAFYTKNALDDLCKSLESLLPGFSSSDFLSQVKFDQGQDVWLNNSNKSLSTARLKVKSSQGEKVAIIDHSMEDQEVDGISYCGPLRARFLGYFGFILNILDT